MHRTSIPLDFHRERELLRRRYQVAIVMAMVGGGSRKLELPRHSWTETDSESLCVRLSTHVSSTICPRP